MVESIELAADLIGLEDVVDPDPADAATYAGLLPVFAVLYEALAATFRDLRRLADG